MDGYIDTRFPGSQFRVEQYMDFTRVLNASPAVVVCNTEIAVDFIHILNDN